jgi:hypothetical protein
MPAKQYYVPNMPDLGQSDDEAHAPFHNLIAKIRTMAGVHDVTVDPASKHVTVYTQGDEDYLPNIDLAIAEFGQLPGFTGQA